MKFPKMEWLQGIAKAGLVVAVVLHPNHGAHAQAVGDCVCMEGFVMDTFCINRGTLFDNPTQPTLTDGGPEVHSVHCLVDVPQCVSSGYNVLLDPDDPNGAYEVAYTLDSNGNDMIIAHGRAVGEQGFCTTCTGPEGLANGYRATVIGRVSALGDSTSDDPLERASTLSVTDVQDSAVGCSNFECPAPEPEVGDCVCVESRLIMDTFCIRDGFLVDNPTQPSLEDPGPEVHSLHCLFDVPQCVASGYNVLLDPDANGDYEVSHTLDSNGNDMIISHGRAVGEQGTCTSCTGPEGLTNGYRATVIGRVSALGDSTSDDPLQRASTLVVSEVLDASVGCDTFECPTFSPTTTPMDGGTQENVMVDCNDFQSEITLSSNPMLTMSYVINTVDSETNVVLTPDEIAAGGVFSARLTLQGTAWIGFSVSTNGRMVPSEAVIGLPSAPVSQTNPGKYGLNSYAIDASGINLMGQSQQTLRNNTVTQENGVTTMTFSKLLNEPGEIPINPNGPNTFLYAIGPGNDLAYHGSNRGSFDVVLEECTPAGVSEAQVVVTQSETYQSTWKAHGTMAAIAWGFFAPVAVASALLRSLIPGEGLWFQIHRALNTLCWVFTIIVFSLAVSTINRAGGMHWADTHQKVGLSIFVIVAFQCIGGIFRPHVPPKPASADEPGESKSKVRFGWEIVHRLSGVALLGMAFYNVITGLGLYSQRFEVDTYAQAFWGWIVAFFGLVIILTIYAKFGRKK